MKMVGDGAWTYILLQARSKRPIGSAWQRVTLNQARAHVASGGNVGVICGEVSDVDVLDFDDRDAYHEMCRDLEPLPISVHTGSGKFHHYFRHEQRPLPAKIRWSGRVVGEVQRGPNQYVVCPPSIHPDSRQPYQWSSSFLERGFRVSELPTTWRAYLTNTGTLSDLAPADLQVGPHGVPEAEPWLGPPPEELLAMAMKQPGARRRSSGVKFQCPECLREGHDRSKDNALVGNDGRWGCAYAPGDRAHRWAIGVALGVLANDVPAALDVPGDGNFDWTDGIDLDATDREL